MLQHHSALDAARPPVLQQTKRWYAAAAAPLLAGLTAAQLNMQG